MFTHEQIEAIASFLAEHNIEGNFWNSCEPRCRITENDKKLLLKMEWEYVLSHKFGVCADTMEQHAEPNTYWSGK